LLQTERHSRRDGDAATADASSALDLLRKKRSQRPIVTMNEQLDALLGGGVAIGEVTEFCTSFRASIAIAELTSILSHRRRSWNGQNSIRVRYVLH